MSEDSPTTPGQPTPEPDNKPAAESPDTSRPARRRIGVPAPLSNGVRSARSKLPENPPGWLTYSALGAAAVALIAVIILALTGGFGGKSTTSGAGILDGFINLAQSDSGSIESFQGKLPPGFPSDFPRYSGAQIVVSWLIHSPQGANFFAIYSTGDNPDSVLNFYQQKLEKDPWQIDIARASDAFSGVRFSRPDNADVQGDVSIHRSDLDGKTAIFVSYQDVSNTSAAPDKNAKLGPSRQLPSGFPTDQFPIYKSSTVTETYLQKDSGSTSYVVTFVTKDSADQVLSYYRDQFQKKGWQVTDAQPGSQQSQAQQQSGPQDNGPGIDFTDSAKKYQGSVQTDVYQNDKNLTKVDLVVQVGPGSTSRGGN